MPKTTANYIDISERKVLLRVVDIILLIFSLWLANTFLKFDYIDFSNPAISKWIFIIILYYSLFGEVLQLYNLRVSNDFLLTLRSVIITGVLVMLFYVFTPFISPSLPDNRLQIVYFYLIITVPIILWRFLYMSLLFSPRYFKNILIIGHSSRIKKILSLVKDDGFHYLPTYISDKKMVEYANFKSIVKANIIELVEENLVTEIIVCDDGFPLEIKKKLNKNIILLFEKGINIKSFERFYEETTNRIPKEYLTYDFYKYIHFSNSNHNKLYLFFRRFSDIFISLIGVFFLVIVLPFVFIGNLLGNRGAIFYTQKRIGKKGKVFTIYKLRSMVNEAEKNGAVWAKKNDARITFFGKFLRNTRLDEMPQFYNILIGDMSFIGPRPERPKFVKDLEEKIPFYAIRHVIRPGLTGWAQVNYQYANTLDEQEIKLRYDLYYIKERSTFLDFKILLRTISTVLFFKGQ